MKVAELTGAQLDYWAARADGRDADEVSIVDQGENPVSPRFYASFKRTGAVWWPSSKWSQGGPIIEREGIATYRNYIRDGSGRFDGWIAAVGSPAVTGTGETLLIAAMRAYVASKFGDEVA